MFGYSGTTLSFPDAPQVVKTSSLSYTFGNLKGGFDELNRHKIDSRGCTNFASTFDNCVGLDGFDLTKLNTSRATNMGAMLNCNFNQNLGSWDVRNNTNFASFTSRNTTWSTENYGATLMGWLRWDSETHAPQEGWVLKSNVNFHAGNAQLVAGSEAALAREYYINTLGWSITDGGLI